MMIKLLITVLVAIIVLLILALCRISSVANEKADDIIEKYKSNDSKK